MKPILPAWDDPPDIILPPDLHAVVGGNELVAQVLARRGLITPAAALAFLDPAEYAPKQQYHEQVHKLGCTPLHVADPSRTIISNAPRFMDDR